MFHRLLGEKKLEPVRKVEISPMDLGIYVNVVEVIRVIRSYNIQKRTRESS